MDEKNSIQAKAVLEKLGQFKYIYIFYFLANILHSLALLSKVFWNKFIDVTTIGSIICSEIVQLCMMFTVESRNLNVAMFNEDTSFHVLSKYSPLKGHLRRL